MPLFLLYSILSVILAPLAPPRRVSRSAIRSLMTDGFEFSCCLHSTPDSLVITAAPDTRCASYRFKLRARRQSSRLTRRNRRTRLAPGLDNVRSKSPRHSASRVRLLLHYFLALRDLALLRISYSATHAPASQLLYQFALPCDA